MDADPVALRRPAFVCFCGACIHLVASAALVAVAYRSFGGQGAAWALGAVFLSCLAVPFFLPRRAPRIAAPGAGVVAAPGPDAAASGAGGRAAGDGRMELPAAFKFKRDVRAAPGLVQCSICLNVVREGDKVRKLPACGHIFHARCIDRWLPAHPTCPICRAAVGAAPRRPEV
jgi:E3 ubiquitin-protein ligase ATL41